MESKVKWLLVGPGDIAQKRVAPGLAAAENSEIVGIVYEAPREQALALADQYGVPQIFNDLREALSRSDANAVYLATPVWLHSRQAVLAMEAGRHVLVEKPLGLSEADCAGMLAAAEKTGLTAACAYYRRLYPRYRHAAELIGGGGFGQVVLVRMTYFSWFDPQPDDPKHWRVVRARSGGGPLADMGSQMFDVLIGLFGLPASVYARCENLVHNWDVEDCASAVMRLRNGAHVLASFHWNSRTWRHEFEMVGTQAKLNWLPYDTGAVVKTVGRDVEELELPNAENVHLPVIQDFVDALLGGRQPVCPVQEAVKTNILLDAVYASAAQNREVELNP